MESTVQVLLSISVCAFAGLLMSRVCKLLKLPAVTGYLVAGILIGPYCLGALGNLLNVEGLGFVSMEAVEGFKRLEKVFSHCKLVRNVAEIP